MQADELAGLAAAAVVDVEPFQRAVVGIAGDSGHGHAVVGLAVAEAAGIGPEHARVHGGDHAVPALAGDREPLDRLAVLHVRGHAVVPQDRGLPGGQRPARLLWMAGDDVQLAQPGRVRDEFRLGERDPELAQHVGAADDAAVAGVAVGVVALHGD